jgi:selenocysteine-specific elongation factor
LPRECFGALSAIEESESFLVKKQVTIGVAGHVDHGKTSLVRSLTGIDTDRMQEEKRRGLSIDSGIARMELAAGAGVSLVDVPGHIHFLKNTIRGLYGVDACMLVVSADDGVMPQTRDHLEILRMFGVERGIVVLTKADLVDEETLELGELEIREMLEGSFLEDCPVIPFSAIEGTGTDEIRMELERLFEWVTCKDPHAPFRLWVDRVKSFSGFGTVVSGTVLSGTIQENDPVQLLPNAVVTRARSLESHHVKEHRLQAGQRAGINLHKISLKEVTRGMALTEPGALEPIYLLNADIHVLKSARDPLRNRHRVKMHLGTSVTNTQVVLMEKDFLAPGEHGLAQLRLMRPLGVMPLDPFVLSLLNKQSLIGGGRVLEIPKQKFRPAKAERIIPFLKALKAADVPAFVDLVLHMERNRFITSEGLGRATGLPSSRLKRELEKRHRKGDVISFGPRGFFPKAVFRTLKKETLKGVETLLAENPLKKSVSSEEIRRVVAPALEDMPFQRMLSELSNEGKLIKQDGRFRIPNLSVQLSEERETLIRMLLDYAEGSWFVPVSAGSFCKLHRGKYQKNEIQRLLDYLNVEKRLIRLNNMRFMIPRAMDEIKERVRSHIEEKGDLKIADCKRILGYGRTVGVHVFDYLDSVGFTEREGESRILR